MVYLADIVIYSQSLWEHEKHSSLVFQRSRENKLFVKKKKCEFDQRQITILRHKINEGMIKMDENKVRLIREWPEPSKLKELCSFLGLANYYRRFIKGYSKMVASLIDLLKKDREWEWSSKCQAAFDELKGAMSLEPVLRLPNLELPFEV